MGWAGQYEYVRGRYHNQAASSWKNFEDSEDLDEEQFENAQVSFFLLCVDVYIYHYMSVFSECRE